MTDRNAFHGATRPIFSAVLTPYRSLGPAGFLALMLGFGAACFASGMVFLAIGAWPVMIFLGLDVVLLWLFFRLSYRSGRAYEEVDVFADSVDVRRVSPAGRVEAHSFNPYWARLAVERLEDEGVVRILLSSHGRLLEVGAFLNPVDKESFANAFAAALAKARRGGVPA